MKRRDFLLKSAAGAGLLVPAWAVARPCPPSLVSVAGGTSATTTCSNVSLDSDWTTRSTAPGVFCSHNFTYKNSAKTQLIANDADVKASGYQVAGDTTTIHWDQAHKLSGNGSLRMSMPASQRGAFGDFGFSFDGIGLATKNTSKHQFYVQFAVYADSIYRDFYYGSGNVWGGKIAIIQSPNTSFEPSEIVIRRDPRAGGFLQSYRYTPSGGAEGFELKWPSLGPNYTYLNFYDAGSPAVTNDATLRQRHGNDYYGLSDTAGTDPSYQNAPRLVANGWTVFEVYVDQVNQVVKIWCAPHGSAPVLIMGAMNARIATVGTMDRSGSPAKIYTGLQLLNYHNNVTNWPSTDTFLAYSEVIGSDNAINFPGGYTLPFPGTQVPTGYPPAGTNEG